MKVHFMWRGMWRCVYCADGWTLAAHGIAALLFITILIGIFR